MKRMTALSALFFVTICLTGCGGDPHEAAVQDMLDIMGEFDTILADVNDQASAEAMGPKVEKMSQRMDALAKEMNELEEPSEEKQRALEEKYGPRIKEIQDTMNDHMVRIRALGPDVLLEMNKQMRKFNSGGDIPQWIDP